MFRTLATSSIALAALAAPALSEITPAEVWEQLIAENAATGMTVTEGNREEAGDTLTITDAVFANESDTSALTITLPKVVMNQTGDGAVRWSIDGDITGEITDTTLDDQPVVIPFTLSVPGNETVSSGSVDDLTHEYKADSAVFSAQLPSGEDNAVVIPLTMAMDGLTGTQRSTQQGADGARETAFDGKLGALKIDISGDLPETAESGAGTFSGGYAMNGLDVTGKMVMASGSYDMNTQMEEALKNGAQFQFDLTYADSAGTFEFAGTDLEGTASTGNGTFSSGPGTLRFSMSDEGLNYAGSMEGSENEVTVSTLPFPIRYVLSSGSFDFAMPVMQSDTPAPFRVMTAIKGLTINDELWGLFDPTSQLPRDPADLNIDLTGEMTLPESLFAAAETPPASAPMAGSSAMPAEDADSDADAAASDAMPADDGTETGMPDMPQPPEVLKITINDVSLKAVGADAKVSGELAAPEGGSITVAPVGQIDGEFLGVNALLDKLGAMGLVPQDQMMAARMMLTMFLRPAEDDPNKLTTRLEFKEDGSVFANGQQVK
ncbi:DUF2125 domain-containing protein [Paracoccus sp. M683]|uniref:DUF2125 domain-containing protein n=1 Tax=Paracoccus sp. M683 TaxID=2594268 RepID=UPI00118085DF|nr:DUF2125 domain-containing protein [Paracoccus sp. M683]TRW98803.1 DUF2125 domain-containing protein [Paracoccus sp. M683]